MKYDVVVSRANGSVRVWAFAIPEADARNFLWVAVRENTADDDQFRQQSAVRVEVRESQA